MKKLKDPALSINILIIILEIIGTAISLTRSGAHSLIYYTVLSNILALVSCVLYACFLLKGGEPGGAALRLRYCATVCLSVTFFVVVAVFVPMALPYGTVADILYKGPQIYHHLLCPILSFISFCFFEGGQLSKRIILIGALPTLLYAIVSVMLNILRVIKGPYPFLLVYEQPWYVSVLWFVLIMGFGAAFAALVRLLHNKFSKKGEVI